MKKKPDDSEEIIVNQPQFGRFKRPRPFSNDTWFIADEAPYTLHGSFVLADGHTYAYEYTGLNDLPRSEQEVVLLANLRPEGFKGLSGGLLFNSATRPRTERKTLIA